MSNERLPISSLDVQVLRFLGRANLIFALLSVASVVWKMWAYHQFQSFPAASFPEVSHTFESVLYFTLIVGVVLFLLQAYTGWRLLRQDLRIIKASIAIFCFEILYFGSIWAYSIYFRGGRTLTMLLAHHPAVILDLQMVVGYPAAGITVLYCFQKFHATGSSQKGAGGDQQ